MLSKVIELYKSSPKIDEWAEDHSGAKSQINKFKAVNTLLFDNEITVPSSHISKSCELPVVLFPLGLRKIYVFARDNFYDIKVTIIGNTPIELDYDLILNKFSIAEYMRKFERDSCGGNGSFDEWFEGYTGAPIISKNGNVLYCANYVKKVYCEGINKIEILSSEAFEPYSKSKMDTKIYCYY